MTTALEILDSAVKIGLGAIISGAATYLVTRRGHVHDLKKAAVQDRRTLIREAAKLIEEATAAINVATYALEHAVGARADSERSLIESINKVGQAKSLAVLLGAKALYTEIGKLHQEAESLAGYYLAFGVNYRVSEANKLLERINAALPSLYSELEAAYASTLSTD